MAEEFLTISQAATICGVSHRTIFSWLQTKKISSVRTVGGTQRILKSSLGVLARPVDFPTLEKVETLSLYQRISKLQLPALPADHSLAARREGYRAGIEAALEELRKV